MMQGLLRAVGAGGMDPQKVMAAALSWLPKERHGTAHELSSLLGEVHRFGPPDPPTWSRDLLQEAGAESGISPELLAALSWATTGHDPSGSPGRVGLLGIPEELLEEPELYRARLPALQEGDREAARSVFRAVSEGAELLLELRSEADGSTAGALRSWLELGTPRATPGEVSDLLGELAGTFILYLARSYSSDPELELLE